MIHETSMPLVQGWLKMTDRDTREVLVDKCNAICPENMSIALAQTLANWAVNGQPVGYIYEMAFGNGGSAVDPTGVITYLPPNTIGQNVDVYNQTYAKIVNQNIVANPDPANNFMTVLHESGNLYTDILVTCLLDYGEPPGQMAYDNSNNFNGEYVFDELGLKVWNGAVDNLRMITHVVFHPVQKSLNRAIEINYTLRIATGMQLPPAL